MPPTPADSTPGRSTLDSSDLEALQQAQDAAAHALFLSEPNPRVGCVLRAGDGTLLGQGFTQQAGGPHAEVMALRDAAARQNKVQGATAYVTLEPCSHHGRTGPCCDALIAAGIARVVASLRDPNPRVAGQGFARLQAAGVAVEVLPSGAPLALQARALNIGFLSRMIRKTPWVRLKMAGSLDGRSALADGHSQWITDAPAREDGHAWRARAGAVLTGIGTVLADNPRLDARLVKTPRQPHLVIIDSHLRTPPDAALWGLERQVLIYCAQADATAQAALEALGAQVICLPAPSLAACATSGGTAPLPPRERAVDLTAVLHDLALREVNEVHVEAGATLNGALLQAGLVDELLLYVAPRLLGSGRGLADWNPADPLAKTPDWHFQEVQPIGQDLRLLVRFTGRDTF